MRILIHSNAPFAPSGYANQTALMAERFKGLGHDVAISAFFGLQAGKLNWRGIPIYPAGFEPFGNDIAAAHAKHFKADILLTLADGWILQPDKINATGVPWVCYFPIDSDPLPERIKESAVASFMPVVMSRFGERMAVRAGVDCRYAPHGVDTSHFYADSPTEARRRLGWDASAYIVGMVAHNRGYPSRKSYPEQIDGFAKFHAKHPDSILYIHTYSGNDGEPMALDLKAKALHAGLELGKDVIFASPYELNIGYSTDQMRDIYNAMDVLSSVSMGEGFGIPIVEAQACGTPVLVGDWSSMGELMFAGHAIEIENSVPWWVPDLNTEWRLPLRAAITDGLEQIYSTYGRTKDKIAQLGALQYDIDTVVEKYWQPILSELTERIADFGLRTSDFPPKHTHRWSKIGVYDEAGRLLVPCLDKHCDAGCTFKPGESGVYATDMFAMNVNGQPLDIEDDPDSGVSKIVFKEIKTSYKLDDIDFVPGDVVIDIGAHVGVVSCYLAKKHPYIKVYAYEPNPDNYARLMRNLEKNHIYNVTAFNLAVAGTGNVFLLTPNTFNSGASSGYVGSPKDGIIRAECVSLDSILNTNRITHCKLLKLDCEGAEYDIIKAASPYTLRKIDNLRGEFHTNKHLATWYGTIDQLSAYCEQFIPDIIITPCTIDD